MHVSRAPAPSASAVSNRLRQAVLITGLILVAEVVGGFAANSLALLSDAGHVFTDGLALGLAWIAAQVALRPVNAHMTYGYHRWGILTALVNAISLAGICGYIFYEAYQRLRAPEPVEAPLMLAVAGVGLLANLYVVLRLRGHAQENLNLRAAMWHAGGDALSSVGVIVAGVIIVVSGQYWVDPAISFLIGLVILVGAWRLLREGITVLLEAPPRHLSSQKVALAIQEVPGVRGVHDLHLWSIAPGFSALSAHLWLEDQPLSQGTRVMTEVKERLEKDFRIIHATLQAECPGCECAPGDFYCTVDMSQIEHDHEGEAEI